MSIQQIEANLRAHAARMLQASRDDLDDIGGEAKAFMQANAPWTDRPDDARPQGLPHARELLDYVPDHPAALTDGGQGHLIQGATYGWALELAHGGKYEIVQSTHAQFSAALLARLRQRWR